MTFVATTSAATAFATSIARGGAITTSVVAAAAAPVLAARAVRAAKKSTVATDKKPKGNNNNISNLVKLNRLWYEIPEPFRFFCSGMLGNVCFFAIERVVHSFLLQLQSPPPFVQAHTDSISFFLGYIMQIVTQHLLHAWLVYGLDTISTREKYLRTLLGQLGAYFVALIGSTILNTWLRRSGMPKDIAFMTTLSLFACVNYFVIGWIVHMMVSDDKKAPKPSSTSSSSSSKKGAPAKTKKGDKPTKKASNTNNKDKASKVTKRFGRGGAQQQPAAVSMPSGRWTVNMSTTMGLREPMLDFILRTSDAVPMLQSERLRSSKHLLDPPQQQ